MSSDNPRDDQPLGLTVHSMPSPEQVSTGQAKNTRIGRLKMFFVFLACAAPVVASYFTYYVVRPDGRRNFGELINPQRTLPDLNALAQDGKAVNLRTLKGQWLLVTVAGGACDVACQDYLYLQRQLRESMGKEKDRLDRVWLVDDTEPVSEALKPALRDATVLQIPRQQLETWLAPQTGQPLRAHLYVVDPMGNWMMRFPANLTVQNAPKAKADLERLLRASSSWDNAGR